MPPTKARARGSRADLKIRSSARRTSATRSYLSTLPNVDAERYVRTIKEGCVNRIIFVGERSLRRAITEFVTH
jgi:hypothetical protein